MEVRLVSLLLLLLSFQGPSDIFEGGRTYETLIGANLEGVCVKCFKDWITIQKTLYCNLVGLDRD